MSNISHELIEKNTGLLVTFIVIAISFATLVEIYPLLFDKTAPEQGGVNKPLPNMKPWTALSRKDVIFTSVKAVMCVIPK